MRGESCSENHGVESRHRSLHGYFSQEINVKILFQYMVLGFEPKIFRTWLPITTRPRAPAQTISSYTAVNYLGNSFMELVPHQRWTISFKFFFATRFQSGDQCDQTFGRSLKWKFAQWRTKFAKVGSKRMQILKKRSKIAKTTKILPKWRNFVNYGYTGGATYFNLSSAAFLPRHVRNKWPISDFGLIQWIQ